MQFLFSYELSEAPLFTLTSVNLGIFHGAIVVMGHLGPETNLAMLSALFLCDKVADKWFLMFFVCLFFSPISSLPPAFFFFSFLSRFPFIQYYQVSYSYGCLGNRSVYLQILVSGQREIPLFLCNYLTYDFCYQLSSQAALILAYIESPSLA